MTYFTSCVAMVTDLIQTTWNLRAYCLMMSFRKACWLARLLFNFWVFWVLPRHSFIFKENRSLWLVCLCTLFCTSDTQLGLNWSELMYGNKIIWKWTLPKHDWENTICMSSYTISSWSPSVPKWWLHECPSSSRPVRRRAPSGLAKHAPSHSSTLWGMPQLPPQLPTMDPAATEDLTPMVPHVSRNRIISIGESPWISEFSFGVKCWVECV